jgi:hypothetical protein
MHSGTGCPGSCRRLQHVHPALHPPSRWHCLNRDVYHPRPGEDFYAIWVSGSAGVAAAELPYALYHFTTWSGHRSDGGHQMTSEAARLPTSVLSVAGLLHYDGRIGSGSIMRRDGETGGLRQRTCSSSAATSSFIEHRRVGIGPMQPMATMPANHRSLHSG